jgi:hypothetical protein
MQSCVGTLRAAEEILSVLSPLAVLCLLWTVLRERRRRRHALLAVFGALGEAAPLSTPLRTPGAASEAAQIIRLDDRRP